MKETKMNNKGFSLVELIIVIAIMAILIVVLAPQYLRYVERSRNSTDLQSATEIVTAIQIYAADPQAGTPFTGGNDFTVTVPQTGGANITGSDAASATAALTDTGLATADITCRSRTAWDTYIIAGTVNNDGSITFTYSSTLNGSAPATDLFNQQMEGQ